MSQPHGSDCFAHGGQKLAVPEALGRLATAVQPVVGEETVPLDAAAGRILAAPLTSPRDVPAFDNVAVDGWAFAGSALAPDGPTRLIILPGRAAAGHPFAGEVPAGHVLRVLTGAVMPAGCDTVAMQEEVKVEGETAVIPAGFRVGANRRRRGEDVEAGRVLFAPGTRLLPQHVGVAAELGYAELPVRQRLKVAVLSSGDEIVEPGRDLPSGKVYDANRHMLKALLRSVPAETADLGILPDEPEKVEAALREASERYDAIVTSGGASRGDEDHVVRTVERLGRLHFWQIAMKPGRPLAFGQLGRAVFVGLPGNPVAAAVCFLRFARPVLLRLAGALWREPVAFEVRAAFAMTKSPGRTELLRATLERRDDGSLWAQRIRREGSGILTSLTEADGLVEVPAATTRIEPGEPVRFFGFAELLGG